MKKNLQDYIKIYPGLLDLQVCKDTVSDLSRMNWSPSAFKTYNQELVPMPGEEERYEFQIKETDYLETAPELMKAIWQSIFNYSSFYKFPWWPNWNGYTLPKFNIYKPTSIITEHCDQTSGSFDGTRNGIPILSIVALLNNDFEGGEFVMFQDELIPLKAGDVMVFPSLFLYPHKVTPIISGTRYSMVSWVW